MNWANDSTGMARVWRNGELIVDYHGAIGYNDTEGPYFKFGVYRDEHFVLDETENDQGSKTLIPATDPYTIYHDDYRRGRVANDVL